MSSKRDVNTCKFDKILFKRTCRINNYVPIIGLWSGVKLSGPQTVDLIPVVDSFGINLIIDLTCTLKIVQSSSYRQNEESPGN